MITRTKLATIFIVQLSCSSLLDSITINNALKIATQRVNVQSPPLLIESPVRCSLFPSENIPRHILEVPSNVLQVPGYDRPCQFHVNRNKTGASKFGTVPSVWAKRNDAQPGRAYLPPVRAGNPRAPYDPLGVLPIEVEDAKLSSPRYSSDSIVTRPEVDRALVTSHVEKAKIYRPLLAANRARAKNAPADEDIRPVYEKSDEDDRKGDREKKLKSNGDPTEPLSTNANSGTDSHTERLRHESTGDSTPAFSTLDWFLTKGGYNSQLHPSTNPFLALVLSHYGRYLSGNERPKVYSYMAVNNIHNNRPFGQYKLECDEPPDDYSINNLRQ